MKEVKTTTVCKRLNKTEVRNKLLRFKTIQKLCLKNTTHQLNTLPFFCTEPFNAFCSISQPGTKSSFRSTLKWLKTFFLDACNRLKEQIEEKSENSAHREKKTLSLLIIFFGLRS